MKFVDTKTGIIYEIEYDEFEKKYCIHYYDSKNKLHSGWIGGATTVRFWKTSKGAINYLKKRFKDRLKEL
jgi:hypothetical protein